MKKKKHYLYVSVGLLLLIVFIIILSVKSCGTGAVSEIKENSDQLTSGSLDEAQATLVQPDHFNIRINATPVLKNGQLNLRIENSSRNTYGCQVKVVLSSDSRLMYQSQLIEPNQSLENCTVDMNPSLSPGIYNASAHYTLYDMKTNEVAGTCIVNIAIHVE